MPAEKAPESLRGVRLNPDDAAALIDAQEQCVFSFVDVNGWPRGVVLSYLHTEGRFWLTAVAGRPHVEGPRRDPRVTVTVNNLGTDLPGRLMLAQRGLAIIHPERAMREWFFPLFTSKHEPELAAEYEHFLDTPNRVVIEVVPQGPATTHDSRLLPGNGRGGPAGS